MSELLTIPEKLERKDNIVKVLNRVTEGIGEGWTGLLKPLIEDSNLLYDILNKVSQEAISGRRVLPASENVLRAFKECKLSVTRIVFLGQDPYPQNNVADGLAFSCSKTQKEQPSLEKIFDAIGRTAYHYNFTRNPDLKRWAEQGILLLNSSLTVRENSPGSHSEIWKPFIQEFLSILSEKYKDIIYVLFGKKAQEFEKYIKGEQIIHKVIHPAAAAYSKEKWDCNDIFNKINETLASRRQSKVVW